MSNVNVLIIDDNKEVSNVLKENLEHHQYNVDCAENGKQGIQKLSKKQYHIILLDMMMPEIDGYEMLRILVSSGKVQSVGIIVITAKRNKETAEAVLGFGADDIVRKPIATQELVARIKAVLKRKKVVENTEQMNRTASGVKQSGLVIDDQAHDVFLDGHKIELRAMEYKLLNVFMKNKDLVLSRDKIMDLLGVDNITDRTIDSHVNHLRKKIGSFGAAIQTVRSFGYRFSEDIKK